MELNDIRTILTSGIIIVAVVLYLVFNNMMNKESADTTTYSNQTIITTDYAENVTGNQLIEAEYVSTNDGDTFRIKVEGKEERVRLLMIDTPEMNYEENNPMPFAEDAKEYTMNMLENASKIEILFDKGRETDHYGRLLVYVFVDGYLLQEALLKEGYAAVRYINEPNNSLEEQFREIESSARLNQLNIWHHENYLQKDGFHPEVITP
nr:thermonuclease family protein [Lysinibacillus timonensis]